MLDQVNCRFSVLQSPGFLELWSEGSVLTLLCAKPLVSILNPYNNPFEGLDLSPFYREANGGSER